MDTKIPIPDPAQERVFEEPWESRAFALVMSLHERGVVPWDLFQARLVQEIKAWEANPPPGETYSYYELWLRALEGLLDERGVCERGDHEARVAELGQATPGHDHVARRSPLVVDPGES